MHAHAYVRAHAARMILLFRPPLICTLKKSEKYFQIFHKKIKLKIIIFKNSKFSFKGGFVQDKKKSKEGKDVFRVSTLVYLVQTLLTTSPLPPFPTLAVFLSIRCQLSTASCP